MEWRNTHLRFGDLSNGDLAVCKLLDHANWNQTGIVLAIYQDGLLYDSWCKEDNMMPKEDWDLTDLVCEYCFTGENVENIQSPVTD